MKVLVRGGGDIASAVIHKLHRSGFQVVCCEKSLPSCVRRTVSFCNAIIEGYWEVEGVRATYIKDLSEIETCLKLHEIAITTIPDYEIKEYFQPQVFIDATISKRRPDYTRNFADLVIGLGPEIEAGKDADVVIETMRGHNLGSLIYEGKALPNTGIPGNIAGITEGRVLRAPCDGYVRHVMEIGDLVEEGDPVCRIADKTVKAPIAGVVRGLIAHGYKAKKGLKIGDIDPRADITHCMRISDKGRNIAGAVLEAILHFVAQGGYIDCSSLGKNE